ncbi:substrate-binding periplasmic protein [Chloroflexota bacterium]
MMTNRKPLKKWQWLLIGVAGVLLLLLVGRPTARWLWHTLSPAGEEQAMLPYGELRVGIDASYPPFGLDINGDLSGLDVDLAEAVAAELNVPLRFINMGYDGLYDSLKADQADALFSALRVDPLRFNDARYTRSYFDAGQVLVRPPGSSINTMHDLEGRWLAVEFGTEGDLEARTWQRRLHQIDIAPFEVAVQALDAVLAGQADAALVDAISAHLWLNDHEGLAISPIYVTHDLYAVAVQVNNVKLWQAIDQALTTLIEDGTIDEIIARWL